MKNMAFGIAALAAALVVGVTTVASAQAPVAVYYPPAPAARPAPPTRTAAPKAENLLSTQPVPALPAHLRDQLGKRNGD